MEIGGHSLRTVCHRCSKYIMMNAEGPGYGEDRLPRLDGLGGGIRVMARITCMDEGVCVDQVGRARARSDHARQTTAAAGGSWYRGQ